MTNANYTTSAAPQLTITCHADLQIVGTADNLVLIDIEDNSPASRVDRQEDVVKHHRHGRLRHLLPDRHSAHHRARQRRCARHAGQRPAGHQHHQRRRGAARCRPDAIKTVQGDLSVRDTGGDVQIDVVRGDAKLKRVGGSVAINKVAGDLVATDLDGGLAISNVGGDASIETELHAGQSYVAKASGDLIFRVDGGGGQFAVNCKGDLRVRLPMTNWTGNERSATGTYGDGSSQVTLMANGDLLVLPGKAGTPWDADQISEQVETMIESAMSQFETQMSKVQRDLEQRFGQMDKQTEKAAERAARSAERAKRKAERAAGSWSFSFGRPPFPPTPPSEPVSDQERLLILKMVEEGKINVDQAAQLLSALES